MSLTTTETTPDVDRGPQILAICGAMTGLAVLSVLLRLLVRVRVVRAAPGRDDYLLLAAAAVLLAEVMVIVPEVHYGAGRRHPGASSSSSPTPDDVVTGLRLNFVTQPLCLVGLCLTKVSVGLFLLRLTPSKRFCVFIWGVIWVTIISALRNLCKFT